MKKPSDPAPAELDHMMPQRGGSHIRQTDGSLKRVAFTVAPGDPDHPDTMPAPASPIAQAIPDKEN